MNHIFNWIRCLRIHQWAKNLLLLMPVLAAHEYVDRSIWLRITWGMLAFSLVASATYIFNDVLDLKTDRAHGSKRHRPLASGVISIRSALIFGMVLFSSGLVLSFLLTRTFGYLTVIYVIISLWYSWRLKRIVMLDVFTLALLYSIRVLAGAAIIQITLSNWLLAFCIFLFLSLALAKRVSEIINKPEGGNDCQIPGRGYVKQDLNIIYTMGIAAGYVAAVVLTLYLNSEKVISLYETPAILWGGILIYLYWISRIWLLICRGKLFEDPIVFAIHDRVSYGVVLLSIILFIMAGPM